MVLALVHGYSQNLSFWYKLSYEYFMLLHTWSLLTCIYPFNAWYLFIHAYDLCHHIHHCFVHILFYSICFDPKSIYPTSSHAYIVVFYLFWSPDHNVTPASCIYHCVLSVLIPSPSMLPLVHTYTVVFYLFWSLVHIYMAVSDRNCHHYVLNLVLLMALSLLMHV